jgi:hypothetical protein
MPAVEHRHPRVLERSGHLLGPRAVVVVVPQDGQHRLGHSAARVGKRGRLLNEPVRREVAGEQDEVGLVHQGAERALEVLPPFLRGVDVSHRGDAEACHGGFPTRSRFASPLEGYMWRMGSQPNDAYLELVETMKRSAAALRDANVPFLLGGGLAAWARGGPPTDHDVDLLLRERDVERAEEALADAGLRLERPPEGWLVKAWDGEVLVDLIFRPAGGAVGDEHFERATTLEVLVAKLLALTEQEPDFGPVLEIARSLREQIDWDAVRSQAEHTPFGAAFFTLVERLGIVAEPVGSAS